MLPIEKLVRKKPVVPFSLERKQQYLELFRNHPDLKGCKALCAEAVGISMSCLYDHLKRDPEFAEAFEDAFQAFIDENLFIHAVKRARDGVERPIIGGKFKDEIVATERVYSDSLMLAMLRAHRPEFKDKGDGASGPGGSWGSIGQGGVMVIPSAPGSIGDWQAQFGELAKGQHGRPGSAP